MTASGSSAERGDDVEFGGLTADSRRVRPGNLFAALNGTSADGRAYVADALAKGAVAVLGDASLLDAPPPVPLLVAEDPRRALARAAARFFGRQPRTAVAVTGTNGKTSTASFVRQLWTAMGRPAASVGTLGVEAPGREPPVAALTTPEPITLHRTLAELAAEGVEHLAVEASSHGLDQRRLDGLAIRAAAFTNLTRDHFDYHGTAEAYLAAKRRLFDTLLPEGGAAVLNADVPEFGRSAEVARARRLRVLDYGREARALRLLRQEPLPDGQAIVFAADGREHAVRSRWSARSRRTTCWRRWARARLRRPARGRAAPPGRDHGRRVADAARAPPPLGCPGLRRLRPHA
jgi:UDP-N-acetylmuramoyl-L-alanyl-D-glutamate--2,6-diaminopimelate ligase